MHNSTRCFGTGGLAKGALIGALVAFPAPFAFSDMALSVGAQYATGDYGTGGDDIDDVYAPVTLDVESDRLLFRLTVPYASVDGPEGSVLVADGVLPGEGPDVSESGIGDVIASLTAKNVYESADQSWAVDLTGTVKFGTADEDKGLGTGENDYSAQVDVYRMLSAATLYATAGYKVRGEPEGYDLDDTWFAGLGGMVPVGVSSNLGLGVNYRPEVVSDGDPASEVTVFASHRFVNDWRLSGHVLAGLADGSPDWGVGLRLKVPF